MGRVGASESLWAGWVERPNGAPIFADGRWTAAALSPPPLLSSLTRPPIYIRRPCPPCPQAHSDAETVASLKGDVLREAGAVLSSQRRHFEGKLSSLQHEADVRRGRETRRRKRERERERANEMSGGPPVTAVLQ